MIKSNNVALCEYVGNFSTSGHDIANATREAIYDPLYEKLTLSIKLEVHIQKPIYFY